MPTTPTTGGRPCGNGWGRAATRCWSWVPAAAIPSATLTADFDLTAVDLSPEMLALSQRLNPGVPHHLGDMRQVRLGQTFDAVAIHDAVCYLLTEDDLRATFATARAHLNSGGLLPLSSRLP